MKKLLLALISCMAINFAVAQIGVTAQGPTPLAVQIQNQVYPGFDWSPSTIPSTFNVAGLNWNLVSNPSTFKVGNGYSIDLSYVGQESVDVNWLGINPTQFPGTVLWLYDPYSQTSRPDGYKIATNTTSEMTFGFVHCDLSAAGGISGLVTDQVYQTDSSFRFYRADVSSTQIAWLMCVDDRYPHLDGDDGQFLIQQTIPEPATYGLCFGSATLVIAWAFRFQKRKQDA